MPPTTTTANTNTNTITDTTSNFPSLFDSVVEKLFNDLSAKLPLLQAKAAIALKEHLQSVARETSTEHASTLLNTINRSIYLMLSSASPQDRIGAILAIEQLLGYKSEETITLTVRFANYLRKVIPGNNVQAMQLAARALGKLASLNNAVTPDLVDYEIKRALEWLQETPRHGNRRHAAALILYNLAISTPSLIYSSHINISSKSTTTTEVLYNHLWVGVHDPEPEIREASAAALGAIFDIINARETSEKKRFCYNKIMEKAMQGLEAGTGRTEVAFLHGALLVCREVLEKVDSELAIPDIPKLNRILLGYRTSSNPLVSINVMALIPALVSANNTPPSSFSHSASIAGHERLSEENKPPGRELFLKEWMGYLVSIIGAGTRPSGAVAPTSVTASTRARSEMVNATERREAFITIGKVALAVVPNVTSTGFNTRTIDMSGENSGIFPYLDDIFPLIKDGLVNKRRSSTESAVYSCLGMLMQSVSKLSCGAPDPNIIFCQVKQTSRPKTFKSIFTNHMIRNGILDLIFEGKLTDGLTRLIIELLRAVDADENENRSEIRNSVEDHLLNKLSMVLSGKMYVPSGSPIAVNANTAHGDSNDMRTVLTALQTLGDVCLLSTERGLVDFIIDAVLPYLDHSDVDVRTAAARNCAKVLARDPACGMSSVHALERVYAVLGRLVGVGVADADSNVRVAALMSLEPRFDHHLSQAPMIQSIFVALNDEVFAVREVAIEILARLVQENPGVVMPLLRKLLIHVLTELEHSMNSRGKVESAQLLAKLLSHASDLSKPYTKTILRVLQPKIRDTASPQVASAALKCLACLARNRGPNMISTTELEDDLVPSMIDMLEDQSSSAKRGAALNALGNVLRHTGFVIEPLMKYPRFVRVLTGLFKSEMAESIRKDAVMVVGVIGAVDPYRLKNVVPSSNAAIQDPKSTNADISLLLVGMDPSSDDYYPKVAINALAKVLRDPTLNVHHQNIVTACMYLFDTLGMKCAPFLPQIIPPLLDIIRTQTIDGLLEFYFQQLARVVNIMVQHMKHYMEDMITLVQQYWNSHTSPAIQFTIISLMEALACIPDVDFKPYMPRLLPDILDILEGDASATATTVASVNPTRISSPATMIRTLQALAVFGNDMEEYLHLVIPVVTKLFDEGNPLSLRKAAVGSVARLLDRNVYLSDHASLIIQPLIRILHHPGPGSEGTHMREAAMKTLLPLIKQMGITYRLFAPTVEKVLTKCDIRHREYEMLVEKLRNNEPLSDAKGIADVKISSESHPTENDTRVVKCLPVNQHILKRAWEASQHASKEDWVNWFRHLNVQLLRESPSHALRACGQNASVYYPLARELFNVAFVSCWRKLSDEYKADLLKALEIAIHSPSLPPEILQILLNMAEYMERVGSPLPIKTGDLSTLAVESHAYAKALHYKEAEYLANPTVEALEGLIGINTELQLPDAAVGLVSHAQKDLGFESKESWYERLHRFDDALKAYNQKWTDGARNREVAYGRMRCLHALGKWEELAQESAEAWKTAFFQDSIERGKVAAWASAAAWGMHRWEKLEYFSDFMRDRSNRTFYKAVLAITKNEFEVAQDFIDRSRVILDADLTALVGESYHRGYSDVIRTQVLAELEEAIVYKQSADEPSRQGHIKAVWAKRLLGCQPDVEVWQRILRARTLVLSPEDDTDTMIKFANLCRRTGKLDLAGQTLQQLIRGQDTHVEAISVVRQPVPPQVVYANLKLSWARNERENTLAAMMEFTKKLEADLGVNSDTTTEASAFDAQLATYTRLLARCYLKQGVWKMALETGRKNETVAHVLKSYHLATQFDKSWYKAWHTWALANFEVIAHYEQNNQSNTAQVVSSHIISSIKGFIQSITLSNGNSLQNTLRLLTLLFRFGYRQEVIDVISEGCKIVSIDTWLEVIPQLIARIHIPTAKVRKMIQQLLADVGNEHAQAIIFPLAVSSKSQNSSRKRAALTVMDMMRVRQGLLVEQALLVSHELVRVAILWPEMWYVGLEEASRQYYGEQNFQAMCSILEPLHRLLENGPETLKEVSFDQAFGRDLEDAQAWCDRFRQTGEANDVEHAWRLYGNVYNQIKDQVLPHLIQLDLQSASPRLLAARDLELAVPGTYRSGQPIVRVKSFSPVLEVLKTKQKPRRLTIEGSDGNSFSFLLKGHEDLRQDERVMQLFGLINTLLMKDSETSRRHLTIQGYPVIPLSTNSGLIGWVDQCDTLHDIILKYRESRKIRLNAEHIAMIRMANAPVNPKNNMPDMTIGDRYYNQMTVLQKAEMFENGLSVTDGHDLGRVLWYKSLNSEAWLERRTNYTRSLAVMSMAGYVLGLGDRHPSNLMIERTTGNVVHIDFGDCFEVAMQREKFPEKIPFRLTRVLVNAMEVAALHGSFKITCEHVMRVLRENKDSVMAVLEAFVFDPLLTWHLWSDSMQEPHELGEHASQDDTNISRPENQNQRAVAIVNRVSNKLTGRDFSANTTLDVSQQVERLIQQATSIENLCQCYVGWCAFW